MRDFAAKQNSDSYPASENIRRETSAAGAEEARQGMEKIGEVYQEKRNRLYFSEGE